MDKKAVKATVKANNVHRMSEHSTSFASLDPDDEAWRVNMKDMGK
jgi:hypothetical protein